MHISDDGLRAIQHQEGFRAITYKDAAGLETVGYGHRLVAEDYASQRFKNPITMYEALSLLREDVAKAESAINDWVKAPLEQHQFDALCSFVFNVGLAAFRGSTLLRELNAGRYDSIRTEFMRWIYVHDPVTQKAVRNQALIRRRLIEARIWEGSEGNGG